MWSYFKVVGLGWGVGWCFCSVCFVLFVFVLFVFVFSVELF